MKEEEEEEIPRTIVHKDNDGSITWVTVVEYPNTTTLLFYKVHPFSFDLQQIDVPSNWSLAGDENTSPPIQSFGNPSVFTIPTTNRQKDNYTLKDAFDTTVVLLLSIK